MTANPRSDNSTCEMLLRIPAMDCISEQHEIEIALESVSGLKRKEYDLKEHTLKLFGNTESLLSSQSAIENLGYNTEHIYNNDTTDNSAKQISWTRLIFSLCIAFLAEITQLAFSNSWIGKSIVVLFSLTSILLVGPPVYLKGIAALRKFRLNMNALMSQLFWEPNMNA